MKVHLTIRCADPDMHVRVLGPTDGNVDVDVWPKDKPSDSDVHAAPRVVVPPSPNADKDLRSLVQMAKDLGLPGVWCYPGETDYHTLVHVLEACLGELGCGHK
jgi:hypothetical protein